MIRLPFKNSRPGSGVAFLLKKQICMEGIVALKILAVLKDGLWKCFKNIGTLYNRGP
jgi:hypothetical protein